VDIRNLRQILEERPHTKLEIINYCEYDEDGYSISLDAILTDAQTGEEIARLEWYYDLASLLHALSEAI